MMTNTHLLRRIGANNMGYSISKTVCLYVFAIFSGSLVAASQFISHFSVEATSDTGIEEATSDTSTRTLTIGPSSDGPGIQSAINDLARQGGGTVILKSGTYDLSTQINLKSNIEIRGESRSGVLLKRVAGFQEAFFGSNVDNVKISDLTADIGESPEDNNGISVVIFKDSNDVTLKQLTLKNSDKMGILLRTTDGATIDNVAVYNSWTGISLQSARDVTVSNSLVSYTLGDGIYVTNDWYKQVSYSSEDVLVTGNTVEKFGDTGIDVSASDTSYRQKNITIEGNTVRNAITSSLATHNNLLGIGISRTTDISVSKCTIDNIGGGIRVGRHVTNANGAPVHVVDNIVTNFDNYGISLYWPKMRIEGNTFDGRDSGLVGVSIGGKTGKSSILSNNIYNVKEYGIRWERDSPDMIIRNNKIINAGTYGIFDDSKWTSRSEVSYNTIRDTKTTYIMKYGIYQGHSGVVWTIKGNTIEGHTVEPMYLASEKNVLG
jgi:Right handed beta helix region